MTLPSTERLALREMMPDDAPFIVELLTDPAFLKYIGDRGVRTLDDARRYIEHGPRAMYARLGIGLWVVETRDGGTPVGICGLLKRDTLPDPDVGYAFLPAHRGLGYATEAARACCEFGFAVRGFERVLAIVSPGNAASVRVLGKLGFRYEARRRFAPHEAEVDVYALERRPTR
jgi:RimJ/RimL family protein N-acetyltransferase